MLQICRAEDGHVFEVNATVWDIERAGSPERFLAEETGVEEGAILAYTADGHRLRNDNIRDLVGVHDQTIYVFNKTYLDLDLDIVLQQLRVHPPLQPPVEEISTGTPPLRPSQISSSLLRTARIHSEESSRILRSLRYQHEALRISSSSLDLHVLAIQQSFEAVSSDAENELAKQQTLLSGLDADLEIIKRVPVHREFVSPSWRKAMELGDKARTLSEYVSEVKMRQVGETCARTHDELRERLGQAQQLMEELHEGADGVRNTVTGLSSMEEPELCTRRAQTLCGQISELAESLEGVRHGHQAEESLQRLRQLDTSLRGELERITVFKNSYTSRCIAALRQISILNNHVVQLPPTLTSLSASFRQKTSFAHIQRLHNLLYVYGATVIEIVRRKEFAQFFFQRAQNILEVMAKLSASERKRRQVYRGEVHGQLPFETRGMDDPVPTIDFTPTGSMESSYGLERTDVEDLVRVLDDLERFSQDSSDPAALNSVREARSNLERLIAKMDGLEAGFDRIAERSLLSSSRFLEYRRRTTEADTQVFTELEHHYLQLEKSKAEQEAKFREERTALEKEVAQLKELLQEADSTHNRLDRDIHALKAQLESESTSRRILENRNTELSSGTDTQRTRLKDALAEATERTREAEVLRQELARVRDEFEDVKALEKRNADKMNRLLEDQANALRRLEEARARGEDLESQIQEARVESDGLQRALSEAGKEKDRLLQAQASEHDRKLRDHIAEADGDRAVLEHQYLELKAALEDAQRKLKDSRTQADMTNSDAVGLREELQRVEVELREARHVERVLREDLRAGRASQSDYEQRLEDNSRLIAQILDVALTFRESHVKAFKAIESMTSHPRPAAAASSSLTDSVFGPRRSLVSYLDDPSPIDPSEPVSAIEALRKFDHDNFLEAINKAGVAIRKWQKQCKEYRERAKGKISFRNFAKGDLALFLPTRNSISKPWAAFNVSFPHYFLKATGHLSEQLKTREWVVARITSIAERMVDPKDDTSNPYGLGDGVKYYMLEVEDWTQPAHPHKRRPTERKGSSSAHLSEARTTSPEPSPGPSGRDPEIDEPFPSRSPTLPTAQARTTSPSAAGPSSLSRLLAQAPLEISTETVVPSHAADTVASSPQPPPSPARTVSTPRGRIAPLPLRPGSRASRASSISKFSGRMPFAGTSGASKAAATTAIVAAEQVIPGSPSSGGSYTSPQTESLSASPDGSASGGMANVLNHQRRVPSYQPVRKSPLATTTGLPPVAQSQPPRVNIGTSNTGTVGGMSARSRLATLASSWGVPFGRSRVIEFPSTPSTPRRSIEDAQEDVH